MRPVLLIGLLLASISPAIANDSTATLGTGGLVLIQADAIAMEKEDLFISADRIKVDYVFRNQSDAEQTYLVAFPMPLIEPELYLNSDMNIANRKSDNFMDFNITVAGKVITPQLEMRALSGVIDVTDKLVALGIPLNPLRDETQAAVAALTPEQRKELVQLGAVIEAGAESGPRWTLKASYYWLQSFPANAALDVSHSYVPATGGWFLDASSLENAATLARFCIDDSTKKALRKLISGEHSLGLASQTDYVLTTAANWSGTIGDFRLVIDKGMPGTVVSFCMNGVKKIAPTQFEVRKTDFTPERDLSILFVRKAGSE